MQLLTAETFKELVTDVKGLIVLDFYAAWCGPCRAMDPTMDALSKAPGTRFTFYKIDVDAQPELAARFDVRSIPTILVFKDGQVIKTFTGAVPKTLLEESLNKL